MGGGLTAINLIHNPWGYIDPTLPAMLEQLRNDTVNNSELDINLLPLSSGYRCPAGNGSPSVRGASKSWHMAGVAVDISTRKLWGTLGQTEWKDRYEVLPGLAGQVGFMELFDFYEYTDRHLHLISQRLAYHENLRYLFTVGSCMVTFGCDRTEDVYAY